MKSYFRTSRWTLALSLVALLPVVMNPVLAEQAPKDPAKVAEDLHAAIAAGDSKRIYEILAPDVLIFESGGAESSLAEYASHHMLADMDFMAGMEREVLDRNVFAGENVAVVSTRSRLSGSFRDQEVDLFSAETLVLLPSEDGWQVQHIHWSSAAAE